MNTDKTTTTSFTARDRGYIDEIIKALTAFGEQNMISYHEEIEFLKRIRTCNMSTMKKSEIKEMANTCVNKYSNLSGIEKSIIFEGYVTGAMEMLQKLDVTVEV